MTIFHVIKYNPLEIMTEAFTGTQPFDRLLPKHISEFYYIEWDKSKESAELASKEGASVIPAYAAILERALLKYEGPLE